MLKKLLKGIVWLVVLLAAAGFLFVWQGLGVNPLEGDAEHLWDLVSNEVDFFARFPGTDLLREPVVEGLGEEEALGFVQQAKDALADAAAQVARDVNPQIPLGLFEIDLENDLRGKEVAIAGTFRGPHFQTPRFEYFIALVRVPAYAKFVSALQRDFVRSRIPNGDKISVVKGKYFKIKDPALAEKLAPMRTGVSREEPDALWFARIRDVFLLTDQPSWIEDAMLGGPDTLPADVDFKTEFIPVSGRLGDVDLLLRLHLAQGFVAHLARPDRNQALHYVSRIVPREVVGNVIVHATPGEDGVGLRLANHPSPDGYGKMGKPHLVRLYERPKADLRFDYSENGIGRLLPRKGVVGALVLHADAETLVSLFMDVLSDADRSNLDSIVAQGGTGGRAFTTYEGLLNEIAKDLADTHMVVVHRPTVFDQVDLGGPNELPGDPKPQPSFSIVCSVKDSVGPEKVVEKISQNLRYLGLKQVEVNREPQPLLHPSGKFNVTMLLRSTEGEVGMVTPAYAALTEGGRYFVFTSSVENMEAILAAASDPEARLLAEPSVGSCVGQLPAEGTLSILARGGALRNLLVDDVRRAFRDTEQPLMETWRKEKKDEGVTDEAQLDAWVEQELGRYRASEYPAFREQFRRQVAPLGRIETALVGVALGVGPAKMVSGGGYLLMKRPEGASQ